MTPCATKTVNLIAPTYKPSTIYHQNKSHYLKTAQHQFSSNKACPTSRPTRATSKVVSALAAMSLNLQRLKTQQLSRELKNCLPLIPPQINLSFWMIPHHGHVDTTVISNHVGVVHPMPFLYRFASPLLTIIVTASIVIGSPRMRARPTPLFNTIRELPDVQIPRVAFRLAAEVRLGEVAGTSQRRAKSTRSFVSNLIWYNLCHTSYLQGPKS